VMSYSASRSACQCYGIRVRRVRASFVGTFSASEENAPRLLCGRRCPWTFVERGLCGSTAALHPSA